MKNCGTLPFLLQLVGTFCFLFLYSQKKLNEWDADRNVIWDEGCTYYSELISENIPQLKELNLGNIFFSLFFFSIPILDGALV